jgi:hypothetical protein
MVPVPEMNFVVVAKLVKILSSVKYGYYNQYGTVDRCCGAYKFFSTSLVSTPHHSFVLELTVELNTVKVIVSINPFEQIPIKKRPMTGFFCLLPYLLLPKIISRQVVGGGKICKVLLEEWRNFSIIFHEWYRYLSLECSQLSSFYTGHSPLLNT